MSIKETPPKSMRLPDLTVAGNIKYKSALSPSTKLESLIMPKRHELNGEETVKVEEAVVVAADEMEEAEAVGVAGEAEEAGGRPLLASSALLQPMKMIVV